MQRAYQRDPEAIERWQRETYPAVNVWFPAQGQAAVVGRLIAAAGADSTPSFRFPGDGAGAALLARRVVP